MNRRSMSATHVIARAISGACIPMVAFGVTTVPAMAQRYDPFSKLGTLGASDNPLDEDQPESVTGRSRPEYAAVPIQAGSLQIMPQVSVNSEFEDNVYAREDNRISDVNVTIRPRLSISRPSEDFAWSLAGEYEATRFFSLTSENTNDYAFRGGLQYQVGSTTTFQANVLHSRNSEQRSSPDSPTGIVRPNRFKLTEGYADIRHSFNRVSLQATADYQRLTYRDNFNNLGEIVDQSFRDRSVYTGGLIAQYTMSPNFAIFAAGSANKRDYRTRIGPVPARDSTGYELALGANFAVGKLMRGTLRAGYLRQNYKDPAFSDNKGLLLRGELAYYVTPLVTLTAKIDRTASDTGVRQAGGYVKTTATLQADYELKRNLIFHLEAGNENRNYNGVDRTDNRFTGQVKATWLLSPRWSLQAGFSHRGQDSSGVASGRDFSENRVTFGILFKGL